MMNDLLLFSRGFHEGCQTISDFPCYVYGPNFLSHTYLHEITNIDFKVFSALMLFFFAPTLDLDQGYGVSINLF
jgi:hypothetical protein